MHNHAQATGSKFCAKHKHTSSIVGMSESRQFRTEKLNIHHDLFIVGIRVSRRKGQIYATFGLSMT